MSSLGIPDPEKLIPWYFPSVGEYAPLLEFAGFEVKFAAHIDRPTRLENGEEGLRHWIEMFGGYAFQPWLQNRKASLIRRWEEAARPELFPEGWVVDYKRLRMLAVKS